MDQRHSVTEKYSSNGHSQHHGGILQVVEASVSDAVALAPIAWEACYHVNQEDLSQVVVSGTDITAAEQRVYEWLNGGARVSVAVIKQHFAGMLVSQPVGDRIEYIRMLFTRPEFEGLGVGKGLVNSRCPKRLVFRTRRDIPPHRMFEVTAGGAKQVCQSDDWKLWTMEWR